MERGGYTMSNIRRHPEVLKLVGKPPFKCYTCGKMGADVRCGRCGVMFCSFACLDESLDKQDWHAKCCVKLQQAWLRLYAAILKSETKSKGTSVGVPTKRKKGDDEEEEKDTGEPPEKRPRVDAEQQDVVEVHQEVGVERAMTTAPPPPPPSLAATMSRIDKTVENFHGLITRVERSVAEKVHTRDAMRQVNPTHPRLAGINRILAENVKQIKLWESMIDNMEVQRLKMETAATTTEYARILETGTAAINGTYGEFTTDDAADIQADAEETIMNSNQISDRLGMPISDPELDDTVEAELALIVQKMDPQLERELNPPPPPNPPVEEQPIIAWPSVPDNPIYPPVPQGEPVDLQPQPQRQLEPPLLAEGGQKYTRESIAEANRKWRAFKQQQKERERSDEGGGSSSTAPSPQSGCKMM